MSLWPASCSGRSSGTSCTRSGSGSSSSTDQTFEESQRSYFLRLLQDIVPDEARILSALADGTRYSLIVMLHH